MNRTTAVGIVVIVALAGAGVFVLSGGVSDGVADRILIGGPALEQNALVYIAEEQGYFGENDLSVTFRDGYQNGVGPVKDMAAGELDLSISAEYPVLVRILAGDNVSIVATIDKYQNEELVGRKDAGILSVADLDGKRIGLPRGTILEFFLGRFLELNGMSIADVTLVNVDASHAADAVANGEVDAIAYFQPHVSIIKERLGDDGIAWRIQRDQLLYGVVAARNDWIESHPDQLRRFLASLESARQYADSHPDETKAIVRKRLNLTEDYLEETWPDHRLTLSLDQSLLVAMNDEGRWMIINNLTKEKTIPDFRRFISTTDLEKIKPDSVNIR